MEGESPDCRLGSVMARPQQSASVCCRSCYRIARSGGPRSMRASKTAPDDPTERSIYEGNPEDSSRTAEAYRHGGPVLRGPRKAVAASSILVRPGGHPCYRDRNGPPLNRPAFRKIHSGHGRSASVAVGRTSLISHDQRTGAGLLGISGS